MPPKRRRQGSPPPAPPSPDRAQSPPTEQQENSDNDDITDPLTDHLPLPFYNTTFSAHRVSPLYLGSDPLDANRLQLLGQRLRDRLVGDVVRGVEVGLEGEDAALGRAGALERVELRWVSVADVLGFSAEEEEMVEGEAQEGVDANGEGTGAGRSRLRLRGKRALHIALRYETASCTALLLPSLLASEDEQSTAVAAGAAQARSSVGLASVPPGDDGMDWERPADLLRFLALPLLLLRMPAPIKSVIGDFLATSFDCRVSPMRLGTRSLVRSWEAWIRAAGLPSRGPLAKDAVLSLGFYIPPTDKPSTEPSQEAAAEEERAVEAATDQTQGLRSIDVIIPAAELRKFAAAGKRPLVTQPPSEAAQWGWEEDAKRRRELVGRLYEEGWEWRGVSGEVDGRRQQPFMEALAAYLDEHLGLNLFHPGVRVVKIACGGFAMSETRLKVFAPTESDEERAPPGQRAAVLDLLGMFTEKAQTQKVIT